MSEKTTYAERIFWLKRVAGSWPKLAKALNEVANDWPRRSHGHWYGLAKHGVGRVTEGDIHKIEALEALYESEGCQANSKALTKRKQTSYIRITPETKQALDDVKRGTWDDTVTDAVKWAKIGRVLSRKGWIRLANPHAGLWFCTIRIYEGRDGFEEARNRGTSSGDGYGIATPPPTAQTGYGALFVKVAAWSEDPLEAVEQAWRLAFPDKDLPYG